LADVYLNSNNPTFIESMFLIWRSSYNPLAKAQPEEHKNACNIAVGGNRSGEQN